MSIISNPFSSSPHLSDEGEEPSKNSTAAGTLYHPQQNRLESYSRLPERFSLQPSDQFSFSSRIFTWWKLPPNNKPPSYGDPLLWRQSKWNKFPEGENVRNAVFQLEGEKKIGEHDQLHVFHRMASDKIKPKKLLTDEIRLITITAGKIHRNTECSEYYVLYAAPEMSERFPPRSRLSEKEVPSEKTTALSVNYRRHREQRYYEVFPPKDEEEGSFRPKRKASFSEMELPPLNEENEALLCELLKD